MRAFAARGSIITSNDGGTRSINLDISGPRPGSHLRGGPGRLPPRRRRCSTIRASRASPSTLSLSQPLVEVRPDWERAAELGMTAEELGFTVAALTDGSYVDEFFLADDKIDIYPLQHGRPATCAATTLAQLPVYTPRAARCCRWARWPTSSRRWTPAPCAGSTGGARSR